MEADCFQIPPCRRPWLWRWRGEWQSGVTWAHTCCCIHFGGEITKKYMSHLKCHLKSKEPSLTKKSYEVLMFVCLNIVTLHIRKILTVSMCTIGVFLVSSEISSLISFFYAANKHPNSQALGSLPSTTLCDQQWHLVANIETTHRGRSGAFALSNPQPINKKEKKKYHWLDFFKISSFNPKTWEFHRNCSICPRITRFSVLDKILNTAKHHIDKIFQNL